MRTIDAPGVEIKEVDLSLRAVQPVGTKVLLQGFASQGPTNELLMVSTKEELDQIYFAGAGPTNAAERYFYYSASEILNSPATLYTTRLPYGSGDGEGFDGEYVALCYPMVGTKSGFVPVASTYGTMSVVNELEFTATSATSASPFYTGTLAGFSGNTSAVEVLALTLSANSIGYLASSGVLFDGATARGTLDYSTGSWLLSTTGDLGMNTINATYTYSVSTYVQQVASVSSTTFQTTTGVTIGEPVIIPLKEEDYQNLMTGNISWNTSMGGVVSSVDTIKNAGMVIVNKGKTTINEKQEGYYIVVSDSPTMADNSVNGYNSIRAVNSFVSLTEGASYTSVPLASSVLGFTLTGDRYSNGTASEVVETAFTYDFGQPDYQDSIIVYLMRLSTSVYADDPNKLYFSPVERFAGALEAGDKRVDELTKTSQSFFIESKINTDSSYLSMVVNPNLSQFADIAKVVNTDANKELNPLGGFKPCKKTDEQAQYTGNIPLKIERALLLADDVLSMDVDIVLDAGLSTIWTYTNQAGQAGEMIFDDTAAVAPLMELLSPAETGSESVVAGNHRKVFNLFNNFCVNTRKDCMFISDPIRAIFVQGENTKTLDIKSRNFSQHVYQPLKNLYNGANSNYSCAYANWVQNWDSYAKKFVWLPFSGYQAAIMSRLDSLLYPWSAPMGLNHGLISNITNIAVRTNQKQQGQIYKLGINPVVFFNGDGFVVWGQKTLQTKPSAFDRINVRRLFLVLERSTMKTMRYFVAEPNTVFTRTRVINTLKPLFDMAKNNEGVYDYMLICSEKNNDPETIDNNELKVNIYLKPVRTAEFIICTFYATRTDANFAELVG